MQEFYRNDIGSAGPEKIRTGFVWYAAILPALGLFLEQYAINRYLGMLVWIIVLVMRPVSCFIDLKMLERSGVSTGISNAAVLLPTIYIFKRCVRMRQNTAAAVVCMICLGYGVMGNGFTVGAMLDDDDILEAVKNEPVRSIEQLKNEAYYETISEALEKNLDNVKFEISAEAEKRIITASGRAKSGSDVFVVEFEIFHDGFTYREFDLKNISQNGNKLEGEAFDEALRKLLAPEDAASADSSQ